MILLDNFSLEMMREAVAATPAGPCSKPPAMSALETIRGIAETGVDRISVGADQGRQGDSTCRCASSTSHHSV
jgi:nicotinate-nucleotide pyrophosphorylase (carboxylating)